MVMNPPTEDEADTRGVSLGRDAWIRLSKNRLALACLWILAGIVALCVGGVLLSVAGVLPDPNLNHLDRTLRPPGGEYLLGSDALGRDLFVRILWGGLVSIAVGVVATLVSTLIGVTYGAVAAYVGGKTDAVMMRLVDILYAMPFVILVIVLMSWFGTNLILLFVAIGAVEWLTMARITRGQVLALKKQEFIEAARSLGLGPGRILFRHLLPNAVGPVIVYTTLTVPAVMRLEAVLSFLGMGVQPPHSSWGTLIKEGADRMESSLWLLVFPAGIFALTLFCLNFLGDGLRDALDPKGAKD
jgi:oligopeptide transport system permease protein